MANRETTIPDGPNAEAIRALADHYCIQRDPRRTARAMADVMEACARWLCEGHVVMGDSLEAEAYVLTRESSDLTRADLIDVAAMLIETIALWDVNGKSQQ